MDRQHRPGRPEDVRDRDQPRSRGHGGGDALGIRIRDHDARAGGMERPQQPEVLVGGGDQLVFRAELQPCQHDVAAVGGRGRERHVLGADADEAGDLSSQLLALLEEAHEAGVASAALLDADLLLRGHGVDRPARERADAAGLEVGEPLENRELRACFFEGHASILT